MRGVVHIFTKLLLTTRNPHLDPNNANERIPGNPCGSNGFVLPVNPTHLVPPVRQTCVASWESIWESMVCSKRELAQGGQCGVSGGPSLAPDSVCSQSVRRVAYAFPSDRHALRRTPVRERELPIHKTGFVRLERDGASPFRHRACWPSSGACVLDGRPPQHGDSFAPSQYAHRLWPQQVDRSGPGQLPAERGPALRERETPQLLTLERKFLETS